MGSIPKPSLAAALKLGCRFSLPASGADLHYQTQATGLQQLPRRAKAIAPEGWAIPWEERQWANRAPPRSLTCCAARCWWAAPPPSSCRASPSRRASSGIRIGVPTKTYWPTIICETAIRQKLFEKEGIKAELTIYRSGAEGFEAIAAGAADLVLNSSSSVAAGLKKGVNVALRRQRRQRLLRLVPGGEDRLADQEGLRARRQEGRHHLGRLRHRHPAPAGRWPSTRSTSRACRSAAAAWCRTC